MTQTFNIRVYYEDTDLAGIVYYANYLRYFERGRTEAIRAVGVDQLALRNSRNLAFVVRRMEIDYHAAARFDDVVTVETATTEVGYASTIMRQRIWLAETLVVAAEVKLAMITLDGRVSRYPDDVKMALERLIAAT